MGQVSRLKDTAPGPPGEDCFEGSWVPAIGIRACTSGRAQLPARFFPTWSCPPLPSAFRNHHSRPDFAAYATK